MKKIILSAIILTLSFMARGQVCLKTDSIANAEVKLFNGNEYTKDRYVLFKGQIEKVKLKFVKESIKICNECLHPEVYSYYNEVIDDKVTGGTYILHFIENEYILSFTRFSDKKNFVFRGPAKTENCTW